MKSRTAGGNTGETMQRRFVMAERYVAALDAQSFSPESCARGRECAARMPREGTRTREQGKEERKTSINGRQLTKALIALMVRQSASLCKCQETERVQLQKEDGRRERTKQKHANCIEKRSA